MSGFKAFLRLQITGKMSNETVLLLKKHVISTTFFYICVI